MAQSKETGRRSRPKASRCSPSSRQTSPSLAGAASRSATRPRSLSPAARRHIFTGDGFAKTRVHKFTPDGRLVRSWGSSGVDPGQFTHQTTSPSTAPKATCRLSGTGATFSCSLPVGPDGNIYASELKGVAPMQDCPVHGHCLSIYSPGPPPFTRYGGPSHGSGARLLYHSARRRRGHKRRRVVGEVSFAIRGRHM
jgi:hypothetical protein